MMMWNVLRDTLAMAEVMQTKLQLVGANESLRLDDAIQEKNKNKSLSGSMRDDRPEPLPFQV